MSNSMWNEVRKTAEELELQIHLASMDARDRWQALKPRLAALEKLIVHEGDRAGRVLAHQISEIAASVRRLRDDLVKPPAS